MFIAMVVVLYVDSAVKQYSEVCWSNWLCQAAV